MDNSTGLPRGRDPKAFSIAAARLLVQLRPQEPNSHFLLGCAATKVSGNPHEFSAYYQRGLPLARQQSNLVQIAFRATQLCAL